MEKNTETSDDFQKVLEGGETTSQQLSEVIYSVKTAFEPIPGFNPDEDDANYHRFQSEIDCDQVYPGIYICDAATAKNKKYLKMIGITHILNAAEGTRFGFVNTNENYYKDTEIKYLGFPLADLPTVDISKYFFTAASFIKDALAAGGKIMVHCIMGVSRSATCVLAYLMIEKGMLATDAIRIVRTRRDIHPNKGFLLQLAVLDNQLRRQRLK